MKQEMYGATGRVGNKTYYYANGKTVARTVVTPKNAKTTAQTIQRVIAAQIAKAAAKPGFTLFVGESLDCVAQARARKRLQMRFKKGAEGVAIALAAFTALAMLSGCATTSPTEPKTYHWLRNVAEGENAIAGMPRMQLSSPRLFAAS